MCLACSLYFLCLDSFCLSTSMSKFCMSVYFWNLYSHSCHVWQVDIDLSTEGDARKVSRLQAQLSLRPNGRFQLNNIGRRRVLVNNCKVRFRFFSPSAFSSLHSTAASSCINRHPLPHPFHDEHNFVALFVEGVKTVLLLPAGGPGANSSAEPPEPG